MFKITSYKIYMLIEKKRKALSEAWTCILRRNENILFCSGASIDFQKSVSLHLHKVNRGEEDYWFFSLSQNLYIKDIIRILVASENGEKPFTFFQ